MPGEAQKWRPDTPETEKLNPAEALAPPLPVPVRAAPEALPRPERVSTAQVEKLIGVTLLAGVLASAMIVFFGGAVYVARHSHLPVHYRVFRGEPSDLRRLPGIWQDVKGFYGRGIIQLGLILLVGLQVLRVVLTGALFVKKRDWMFVFITSIVLALLMYGLVFEAAVRR